MLEKPKTKALTCFKLEKLKKTTLLPLLILLADLSLWHHPSLIVLMVSSLMLGTFVVVLL